MWKTSTGRHYYVVCFLGQGNLADVFPEIRDRKEFSQARRLTPDQMVSLEQLVSAIGAAHPGFHDHFATEVKSGDHLRVQGALVEGAADLTALVTGTDLGNAQAQCFAFFLFGAFIAFGVYVLVVAGVAYFLGAAAQVAGYQTTQFTNGDTLPPPASPTGRLRIPTHASSLVAIAGACCSRSGTANARVRSRP